MGRGTKLAYAYLLIPSNKTISQIAEHRLKTMLAATELGEGFQIAMRDLEIRGTGNILGTEQSGHMHALGFDLYTNLLEKAANTIRAEKKCGNLNREKNTPAENRGYLTENETIVVNLSIPANIPEKYKLHAHHWLIILGRYTCIARKPKCFNCKVLKFC